MSLYSYEHINAYSYKFMCLCVYVLIRLYARKCIQPDSIGNILPLFPLEIPQKFVILSSPS